MSRKLDRLRKDASGSPWPTRIKRMKQHQDKHSKTWSRNEKLLFGKTGESGLATPQEDPTRRNAIAYGWGLVKSLEAQVYVQNPDAIVDPMDESRRERANVLSHICRYDFDSMDLKSRGNLGLIDTFVYGYAAIIEDVKTERDEDGDVENQDYQVRRIHPRDFLLDPRALLLDLSDARYIALAFYPTIGELKDDPLFKGNLPSDDDLKAFPEVFQTTRQDQTGSSIVREPTGTTEEDLDYRTICMWEVHDNVAGKICYFTDKEHLLLGEQDAPLRLRLRSRKLYPVTILALNQDTTSWYPTPELDLVAPQLMALNKIQAIIEQDATTKWRKYIAPASLISEQQAAQITDTQTDQCVIRIERDDIGDFSGEAHIHELDLTRVVLPLPDVTPARDLPLVKEMIEQDIAKVLGYGPIDRGGLPKTRSAREAMAIKEKMEQRLQKREDAIADFYRMFGTKHIQILQQTMDVERYARVYDDAKMLSNWVTLKPEDVQEIGEFEFVVYAGTSGPRTTEAKRASELQLFQTVLPILQVTGGDPRPAFYRLAKYWQWDGVDAIFSGQKAALKQLAMVLAAAQSQQIPPATILNAAAQAVTAGLSQEEIAMVRQELMGQMSQGPRGVVKGERGDPAGNKTVTGAL